MCGNALRGGGKGGGRGERGEDVLLEVGYLFTTAVAWKASLHSISDSRTQNDHLNPYLGLPLRW